jgi:hypothetical protein
MLIFFSLFYRNENILICKFVDEGERESEREREKRREGGRVRMLQCRR